MIATLMLSGVALLPKASAPWSSPVEQPPAADVAAEAPQGWNTITVDGGGSDRFLVRATVNGVELDFLIDSGASYIVLSPDAAAEAGDLARAAHRPVQPERGGGGGQCGTHAGLAARHEFPQPSRGLGS
jgi:predicted aspartyl protease